VRCAIGWKRLGCVPAAGKRIAIEVVCVDLDKKDGLFAIATWMGLHIGNHHNASV